MTASVFKTSQLPESPGVCGWVALLPPRPGTPPLAEAITELAATPDEKLRRMGTTGRARVLMRHNVDVEAAKLAALFTQRPRTQPV